MRLTWRANFRGKLLVLAMGPLMAARQAAVRVESPLGTIRGTVYDSLTARPLAGALVEVSGSSQMATADSQGRFRIDGLSVGPHRVSFSSIELDSIGLFGFARDVQVRANTVEEISLLTPSFRTMYSQLCAPAAGEPTDSAIVFGTVYDAATGARVDSARVHFVWQATNVIDKQVRLVDFSRDARANSTGDYGVCGLPAEVLIATQALTARTATGRVITAIGVARIVRRDMYVSSDMPADPASPPVHGAGVVQAGNSGRLTASMSPALSGRPPCPPNCPSAKVERLPRYTGTSSPPRTAKYVRQPLNTLPITNFC